MKSRGSIFALIGLLLAGAAFGSEAPKERIIWTGEYRHFGLFLSDPDGKNERPFLACPDSNYNPSFSRDGRWIVFTSERFGSADVFRVHPDGSGLERLTDSPAYDDQGALSPDGKTLAFVSTRAAGTADVWLLDIESRRVRNLTRSKTGNFRPSWSPDGRWIAFSSDRNKQRIRHMRGNGPAWELMQRTAIYIVHPDGSGLRRITALDGSAGSPKWSSDSGRVLFAQIPDIDALRHFRPQGQIVSVDVNTGARQVHSDGKNWVWSPSYVSDSEIGYGSNPAGSVQGGIVYTSGRKGPQAGVANPSWSPDGSTLAYDREVPVQDKWMEFRESRDPRYELISGAKFATFPPSFTVRSDGRQLIYQSASSEQLILSNWDGTGSRVIFEKTPGISQVGGGTWSQDGRTFVFVMFSSSPTEPIHMAVMDGDGSRLRSVPSNPKYQGCAFLSLSPDGTRLVCRSEKSEKGIRTEEGLRIVTVADGKTVALTHGWDNTPAWSPVGDRIAFTGFETGDFEIYTIRPNGTDLRQLTHIHGNDSHPVWSPDGKWIAFLSSRMGWKDENLLPTGGLGGQSYGEIFVMRSDGTDVRQLTDNQWEEGSERMAAAVIKCSHFGDSGHQEAELGGTSD